MVIYMTSNHIFTTTVIGAGNVSSINVADLGNLSVSDTVPGDRLRLISANQFLYVCPSGVGSGASVPLYQYDVTDPTDITYIQDIDCDYTFGDDIALNYLAYYDKWVLVSGYAVHYFELGDPWDIQYAFIVWAIDVSNPANPQVTYYTVISIYSNYPYGGWDTYCCVLGDILIVASETDYSSLVRVYSLASLPASLTLIAELDISSITEDIVDIVGSGSNFFLSDRLENAVHSFSYTAIGGLTHLGSYALPGG